jgi:sRNA-binding carbon storage regulator CsrA
MIFNLSAGDIICIGDDITLTVLAVESDLIRFGLETPKRKRFAADDSKACDEDDLTQRLDAWKWN